jgi:hypothetical protein
MRNFLPPHELVRYVYFKYFITRMYVYHETIFIKQNLPIREPLEVGIVRLAAKEDRVYFPSSATPINLKPYPRRPPDRRAGMSKVRLYDNSMECNFFVWASFPCIHK